MTFLWKGAFQMRKEQDKPLDRPDSQQPQPMDEQLDPDILSLVHSELEAHPEALSRPKIDAAIRNYLDAQFRGNLDKAENRRVLDRESDILEDQTRIAEKIPMPDLARREEKFFNGKEPTTIEGKIRYAQLQKLSEEIKLQETDSEEDMLRLVFSRVYNFVISQNDDYSLFDDNMVIYEDAFDVCYFMSLCMFLYESKRREVKGKSLRRFIYEHSPMGFNVKSSRNYFDYDSRPKYFSESKNLYS